MSTPTIATTITTTSSKSVEVEASLWWDSPLLLTDLESVSLSSDLPPPLVKKLNENHAWFSNTILQFKPPSQKSREALNSQQVVIGSHKLSIQPELKNVALQISSFLVC